MSERRKTTRKSPARTAAKKTTTKKATARTIKPPEEKVEDPKVENPQEEISKQAKEEFSDILDRSIHAAIAQYTRGLSPAALANAYWDWAAHLGMNQGKQLELVREAIDNTVQFYSKLAKANSLVDDEKDAEKPKDRRFRDEAWQQFPFNMYYNSFMLNQEWWHQATTKVRGVSKKHEDIVEFMSRQLLDVMSPSNYMLTNPVLLEKTREENGANLVRGLNNFLEDFSNMYKGGNPPGSEKFRVGETLAVTPGKVIYRNRLIELIQYEPTTKKVRPEPIMIVPAWIMKFYILDLSPYNSLVKYLNEQGFTVFIISWKNPDSGDRDLGMEDYLKLGLQEAINVVNKIVPNQKVHGVGYCLGGTILSIFAATLASKKQDKFKSLTFLASQVDFTEAGELTLFVDESQITFLEDMMWEQGYLEAEQMAGAFAMLRSNDLIWSKILHDYVMGERSGMNDIMAWNADPTRMPYKMHTEYLRWLFLNNDLAEGRYKVGGKGISMSDIHTPLFCVGTQTDHVAPWRSVYKYHNLTDTEITFLLTNGGHNAGILSEPGHKGRKYQVTTTGVTDTFIDPETWVKETPFNEGSWWIEWVKWLKKKSGNLGSVPKIGGGKLEPICDAPGEYVFQK